MVSTLAGDGNDVQRNGTGATASFSTPQNIAVDVGGNVYVTETYGHTIRKITPEGLVTDFAGFFVGGNNSDGPIATAGFSGPGGVAAGVINYVYVADGNKIRKVTPQGIVSTLAGSGGVGSLDGPGNTATFSAATFVSVDTSGIVYVIDGNKIRKIETQ